MGGSGNPGTIVIIMYQFRNSINYSRGKTRTEHGILPLFILCYSVKVAGQSRASVVCEEEEERCSRGLSLGQLDPSTGMLLECTLTVPTTHETLILTKATVD